MKLNTTRSRYAHALSLALAAAAAAPACGPAQTAGDARAEPARDSSSSGGDGARAGAPDVSGHWRSDCLPSDGGRSASLDFRITASDWTLDYVTHSDAACATPFVTVRIAGDYALTGPSAGVAGAWEARFGFRTKTVTPHGAAATAYLASLPSCGSGGFRDGVATDVLAAGCAALGQYPGASCGADYDLVSVQGDALRFGQRPADNDLCTPARRPTALSPAAMRRQP